MARETILQKIRSLLALEVDQRGKPEGTLASQMARKMMRKYAVSSDELQGRREAPRHDYRTRQRERDYEPHREQDFDLWESGGPFEIKPSDVVWTKHDQHIYQQIRSIIDQDSSLCTVVGYQCTACFWFSQDLQGAPYCGFFDSYLEDE